MSTAAVKKDLERVSGVLAPLPGQRPCIYALLTLHLAPPPPLQDIVVGVGEGDKPTVPQQHTATSELTRNVDCRRFQIQSAVV